MIFIWAMKTRLSWFFSLRYSYYIKSVFTTKKSTYDHINLKILLLVKTQTKIKSWNLETFFFYFTILTFCDAIKNLWCDKMVERRIKACNRKSLEVHKSQVLQSYNAIFPSIHRVYHHTMQISFHLLIIYLNF